MILTFPDPQTIVLTEAGGLSLVFPEPQAVVLAVEGVQGPPGSGGGGGISDGDKGDITVTASGATWTIDAGAVTLSKMASLATSTILGRATAGTGVPEALTAAQVRAILNVADGATANASDASLRDRSTHTGTQAAGTITGLAAVATSGSASDLSAGTLPAARFDDTAHGARSGGTLHANVVASGAAGFMTGADKTKLDGISGTNTGDVTLAGSPNYLTIAGQVITRALIDLASHVTGKLPFANIADMASGTLFYRKTAGAGAPETQTLATLKTDLGLTGTNSGDQTITLTGDVTGSGTGIFAATIGFNAVDNTKAADMAANTVKANATAGAADPADLAVGTNTVLGRVAGNIVAAQLVGNQIQDDAVVNGKLANVNTATFKGRISAGIGDPEDLSGTQATTLLDAFTSALKGLVPASGGGTTNFLRADGAFAAPGGGGSPGGASGEVQFNNAGAFGGAADVEIETGQLRLPRITPPAAPAASGVKLFGRDMAGHTMPAMRAESGRGLALQASMSDTQISWWQATGNGGTDTQSGYVAGSTGTSTGVNVATTNFRTRMRWREWLVTVAATTAIAGFRGGALQYTVGADIANAGGFFMSIIWSPATGVTNASHRCFVGMMSTIAAQTDVNPSTLLNICGVGYDAGDTQFQFMVNDGTGTATKTALGVNFPKPSADRTKVYQLYLYSPPGTTQSVSYLLRDLETGNEVTGTATTDLPSTTTLLGLNTYISVGGVSSVVGWAVRQHIMETDF